ncbi:hypothetical protein Nepgr_005054 [Nepenthes gracilis]|uniref:Uncharacterized protein n=1 Tax=Nepenthes gracilis TaxID=150966 RepID=A0AAD3S2I6_NEPGR|nr:hypothetical protein Nepgr_005054 [Nepenthes gracilis]
MEEASNLVPITVISAELLHARNEVSHIRVSLELKIPWSISDCICGMEFDGKVEVPFGALQEADHLVQSLQIQPSESLSSKIEKKFTNRLEEYDTCGPNRDRAIQDADVNEVAVGGIANNHSVPVSSNSFLVLAKAEDVGLGYQLCGRLVHLGKAIVGGLICWNVRGLNRPDKIAGVCKFVTSSHIHICGLIEARVKRIKWKFICLKDYGWLAMDHELLLLFKSRIWLRWDPEYVDISIGYSGAGYSLQDLGFLEPPNMLHLLYLWG